MARQCDDLVVRVRKTIRLYVIMIKRKSFFNLSPGKIFVVNERIKMRVKWREIIHALLNLVGFLPLPLPVSPRDLSDDGRHDY